MYEPPITTVTVAADDYDLTDLAAAKAELCTPDTTHDAFLGRAITQTSRIISNACNRVFVAETVSDLFYRQRRDGVFPTWTAAEASRLQLSRWPVLSVVSVIETDLSGAQTTLVADTDFTLDAARGQLVRLGLTQLPCRWSAAIVTAEYQAGFEEIPDDLVEACLLLVTARYRGRGRDLNIRQESIAGVIETQYLPPLGEVSLVEEILCAYRVPPV